MTDADGDAVAHFTYGAFGEITSVTTWDGSGTPTVSTDPATIAAEAAKLANQTYTAREWDFDAGLFYYRARWYDPAAGRFTSDDPIGFEAGDVNVQRYVGNDVTRGTDPTGLWVMFGHTVLMPWDPNASWNPVTTVNTWTGMGNVAVAGTLGGGLSGAGGGFVTGGAVGGVVGGVTAGPPGVVAGGAAGATAGAVGGGISGAMTGFLTAFNANNPDPYNAFGNGFQNGFVPGLVGGVLPGASGAIGPTTVAVGASTSIGPGGTLAVAPAATICIDAQIATTASVAANLPVIVNMAGQPGGGGGHRPGKPPKDNPRGTLPIDRHPATSGRETVHRIKDNLRDEGVGATSYVGVTPQGNIVVTNPDGTAQVLSHFTAYL